MVTKMKGYVPKDERKKILLMCDDIRTHSGIATVAREIVIHTAHKYNFVNVGAAIKHPEEGRVLDISKDTNAQSGIEDSQVLIYPTSGYGNSTQLRQLLDREKPDAIFIITDPRYWVWLFEMESEIRSNIPIIYLNIWDNYPLPMYNREYYESCDLLMGISKQTVNINKLVLGEKAKDKIISYVPHGLNHQMFNPIDETHSEYKQFLEFKHDLFQGKEYDFVLHYNSRNIRRKQIPDTIYAYKQFVDKLTLEQASKCALVLHTQKVDMNGTDLPKVVEALCGNDPQYNIIFSEKRLSTPQMNYLYNCTDAQIQLTSNEGWGLSLTEALLVGNPIIANVTGGMQDQMRFVDNKGEWFTPNKEVPSNHRKTYTEHGEWAFPVFPTSISLQGSPPTPYIFDDRCEASDAAKKIYEVWEMGTEERKLRGEKGRKWALGEEAGFTSEQMSYNIIKNIDQLFSTWKPRKKYDLCKVENKTVDKITHNLVY
jgi:glycosyltransferase involved in cell wall biosynthesis